LFISILLIAGSALAAGPRVQVYQDVEKGIEVGLQGGVTYDFSPPVETPGLGIVVGLELGYDISHILRIKLGYLTENYEAKGTEPGGSKLSLDFQRQVFWGGASFCLLTTKRLFAYLQAGIGYMLTDPQQISGMDVAGSNDVAILAGAGLEYYPNLRHFSFALEAYALISPSAGDVSVAVVPTVRYTFGLGESRVIEPPKDRDSDGVPDQDDKCPDTWGPESNNGCPEADSDGDGVIDREDNCPKTPGPASNAGCPLDPDTDGDGIPDRLDRCPKKPGPQATEGCPDRDEDGIPDHIDKCPDKPGKEENDGCPTRAHIKVRVKQSSIELREKIHFEFGKAKIMRKSFPLLDQVAATLKEHPEIRKLRIEGHTDSKGSAKYNQGLSQRRAQSVVNYLINKGITSGRLVAKGYGEEKPIATNQTDRGRSMNRRVEMIILERAE